MTKPQAQEQQKVAEWAESLGFFRSKGTAWIHNDVGGDILPDQMTFFYRAAHPESMAGDEDLRKRVKYWLSYRRPMLDDNEGLDQIMSAFHQEQHVDRQRILDRVEEEARSLFINFDESEIKKILARIRKEEL